MESKNDLFTEGNWGLREYPKPREWTSLIVHRCPQLEFAPEWRLPVAMIHGHTKCFACSERAPEGLLALWKLHNSDSVADVQQKFGSERIEI
jgi:hypothetical protein